MTTEMEHRQFTYVSFHAELYKWPINMVKKVEDDEIGRDLESLNKRKINHRDTITKTKNSRDWFHLYVES